MGDKNNSFVLEAKNKLKFEDRPVPELRSPHDVLVRVSWTGICGSDVHYWQEGRLGDYIVKDPMVLGHESSGIVLKTGSAVSSLREGDAVAMEPGTPCYHCANCKSGRYNLCPEMAFASTPPCNGTLAKYYVLPADFAHKLPQNVDLEAGALVEPTSVAVHAIKRGEVGVGDKVAVFGAGPVGVLCAGVAKGFGAREVVVIDIKQERLDFAKSWITGGCKTFFPAKVSGEENAAKLKEQLGWAEGADVVLEATGAEPCIQQGMAMLKRGGTYVQVGTGKETVAFPVALAGLGELTFKGSFRYTEGDYETAIDLISRGVLDVKKLISERAKFEDAVQAFEDAKAGKGIKLLIEGVQG